MKEAIQEILKQADYYENESRVNRALCSHVLATRQAHLAKNLLRIAKLAKLIWPCK